MSVTSSARNCDDTVGPGGWCHGVEGRAKCILNVVVDMPTCDVRHASAQEGASCCKRKAPSSAMSAIARNPHRPQLTYSTLSNYSRSTGCTVSDTAQRTRATRQSISPAHSITTSAHKSTAKPA
jgi:hypothetical protein